MPLRLKKRGDIWHYAGTVAGHRLRGSTKTAIKDQAEKIANKIETDWLDRDRYGIAQTLTFAQAAIEYRKEKGEKRFQRMVEDYWKDAPVKEITRGALKRAAIALLPNGSGAHRNRAVIVPTLAIVNYAASLDLCAPLKATRFDVDQAEKTPATWEWVRAFMAHSSPHLGGLCCFMFLTGARISEALGVLWEDVDLGAATASIRMSKIGGDVRVAHMPPPLIVALSNILGERKPENQVFPYSSYRACSDPWEVAIKRAGIVRLTPHSCRHGFATGMLHAGVDIVTIAEMGGWKSPEQIFRTYGHPRRDKTVTNVLVGMPVTQAVSDNAEVFEKTAKNG